ncbi:MAG: nitroreductase/quinone reductase family protein [Myxococcota bacterium]
MRIAIRVVIVLAAAIVALVIVGAESREVVVLHTTDAEGASHTTRLWIVDDAEGAWLRAGHDGSSWFRDLEVRPDVEVERGGKTLAVRAVPVRDPAERARINALTVKKYGWAGHLYAMIGGGRAAIPIRLETR